MENIFNAKDIKDKLKQEFDQFKSILAT